MRLATYETSTGRRTFLRDGDRMAPLGDEDLVDLLRSGRAAERVADATTRLAPDGGPGPGARLVSPLRHPGKQVFVGVNYEDHVAELPPPWKMTPDPFLFSKLQTSIIGPDDAIRLPDAGSRVDYEVELLIVMGRRASRVSESDALDHVLGWTIVNDVTEREIQRTDMQLTWGKGLDTFCPMGPEIVLRDELPDPRGLAIWTTVNGEERQRNNTADMIFSVPHLIAHISRDITLEPGDTISTGTPAGVGYVKDPPVFLQPGDTVTVGVDGIGSLTNPVVAGWE